VFGFPPLYLFETIFASIYVYGIMPEIETKLMQFLTLSVRYFSQILTESGTCRQVLGNTPVTNVKIQSTVFQFFPVTG
jgi:hypothetical protein